MSAARRALEAAKALHGKVDELIRNRGGYRRVAVGLAAIWLVGIPVLGSVVSAGLGIAAIPKASLYAVTRGLSIACELALAAEGVAALNTFVVPRAAHALSGVARTVRRTATGIAERLSEAVEEKGETPETDRSQEAPQQAAQAKEESRHEGGNQPSAIVYDEVGPTYDDYYTDPLDYLDDPEYWEDLRRDPAYDGESPEYFDRIDEENLRAFEDAYEGPSRAYEGKAPSAAQDRDQATNEAPATENEAKELAAGWTEIIDYARSHYPTRSRTEKAYLISPSDADWLFETDGRGNWAHRAEEVAKRWPGATALVVTETDGGYSSVVGRDDPDDGRFCESFATLPAAIAYGSDDIDLDDLLVFDAAMSGDAGLLSHLLGAPDVKVVREALAGFEGWSPNGDGRTVGKAWEECGEIPATSRQSDANDNDHDSTLGTESR